MINLTQGCVNSKFRDRFLSLLPGDWRSHITNLFLEAVRDGAETPTQVTAAVLQKSRLRLIEARIQQDTRSEAKFSELIRIIEDDMRIAINFAAYCLAWESLPRDLRKAEKRRRGDEYRRKWLAKQPATEKQIAYLQKLGYVDPVKSKLHASELIERIKRGELKCST